MWLYPFNDSSYCFFYRVPLEGEKGMPKRRFYHWNKRERETELRKYADPHWIKQVYFQPNIFGFTEYAVLVLGIASAILGRS